MTFDGIDRIARTLLYEGYLLFPYSATSLKNRLRASFGELVPAGNVGRTAQASETIVEVGARTSLQLRAAFLQPVKRQVFDVSGAPIEAIERGDARWFSWQEAREVVVEHGPLEWNRIGPHERPLILELGAEPIDETEVIAGSDGAPLGSVRRTAEALEARLAVSARRDDDWPEGVRILTIELRNACHGAGDATLRVLHSAHVAARVEGGAFESVIDPPERLRAVADRCESDGAWPVLVGAHGDRSLTLHSPIILYDYPEIAPESPDDLFDGTENDELLSLSILSLTDAERRAMASTDPRAAALLARIEARRAHLEPLHGSIRAMHTQPSTRPMQVRAGDRFVKVGDSVRIRPSGRDPLDTALAGARATIVDIAVEVGGREHAVVVLDDDPGRDFGLAGLGIGHRLFIDVRELEP
ncbi:MAG: hypothetical protein HOW73_27505 [Polyangiaceae bacterium]|nr:hypothetical protein [Polyangiaceae bacterium]